MSNNSWVTIAPGIRYKKHPSRRHGARLDRYFTVRLSVDGRQIEEGLGWASQGWTVPRAQAELIRLKEAKRTGQGPKTLREEREANERAKQRQAEEEAARTRREKTVSDLWNRYSKEVIAIGNKPSTAGEKIRMWRTRIEPTIGNLKVNDVTEEDAGEVVRAPLVLDKGGRVIAGKAEAGNIYRLLHHMFRKAIVWKLRQKELGNPLENEAEPKVDRRERLLTGGEIGALMRALDSKITVYPQSTAVIRAAILTGARISELLSLRWQDIRREECELHLRDTKTGFSRRPISAEALYAFDSVERMPGVDFVFRSLTNPRKPLSYSTVEKAFRDLASSAGVTRCTLHTIRHWFATMTANSVKNQRVGMQLTGHKSHSAYMNYIHGDREAARELAEQLAALATGLANVETNVAEIPARNRDDHSVRKTGEPAVK
jgi:integrase